jgi:hypothetical protein
VSEVSAPASDSGEIGGGYGMSGLGQIGPLSLSFVFRGQIDAERATGVDLPHFEESHDEETFKRTNARIVLARADALDAAIARDVHGAKIQTVTDFSGGVDTAGPGALPAALAAIVFAGTPIGDLAALVSVADAGVDFIRWVREKGGAIERVDDGIAFLIGWRAIRETMNATGSSLYPVTIPRFDAPGTNTGRPYCRPTTRYYHA